MKKYFNLLLTCTLAFSPTIVLTSCGNKIEYDCTVNDTNYFASPINIGNIYASQDLTFNFALNSNCYLSYSNSYFKILGHHSHSFASPSIQITNEGNNYTCKISKDIIQDGYAIIYLSAYKLVDYDHSGSSDDIEFISSLTSNPIEKEPFTIGMKIAEGKALDLSNSIIKINGTPISNDDIMVWEETLNSQMYSFITIPSEKVIGDISVELKTNTAIEISTAIYPEYTFQSLSKIAKNSDFYMYCILADHYALDTDSATIKVGTTPLTKEADYTFSTYYTIPYLKINGEKVTDKITIDIPPIQCFDLYANKPEEYETVYVEGEEVLKGKTYKFYVKPLNNKVIQWTHSSTYISVNDTKIFCGEDGFSYEYDETEKMFLVTVNAKHTVGDLYCHFITM